MIFLVSKDPFSAIQLQNQLKLAGELQVEIFLSVEEAEHNLYKLPDIILIEDNLSFSSLLYLTQSVKHHDAQTQVIWLCQKNCNDLHIIYKNYGVVNCIARNELLLEEMADKVQEILREPNNKMNNSKRIALLKKNLLDMDS